MDDPCGAAEDTDGRGTLMFGVFPTQAVDKQDYESGLDGPMGTVVVVVECRPCQEGSDQRAENAGDGSPRLHRPEQAIGGRGGPDRIRAREVWDESGGPFLGNTAN